MSKTNDDLTAAQRARSERQRLRARALADARLVARPFLGPEPVADTGGGFMPELSEPPRAIVAPPAPVVHRALQPRCERCALPFPQSRLLDTFEVSVCDECRDDELDVLITRTEAKKEFLLRDSDLDARPPALRCERRRNPHSARYGDMRLYLRAQVERRALDVWGSAEALAAERARRDAARLEAQGTRERRRLRALRMDVRSALFDRTHAAHAHAHSFLPETYDAGADTNSRECTDCGHVETYEKM